MLQEKSGAVIGCDCYSCIGLRRVYGIFASESAQPAVAPAQGGSSEPTCTCRDVAWGVHSNDCPWKPWKEKGETK